MLPKGFKIVRNFLNSKEQKTLLNTIDANPWSTVLKRKTQHYGYTYDYKKTSVEKAKDIPKQFTKVFTKLINSKIVDNIPDQVLVNEYLPGQGISAHVNAKTFKDNIISITLGSSCIFTLKSKKGSVPRSVDVFLEPGDLILMSDESRYAWSHAIVGRKTDTVTSKTIANVPIGKYPRGRRVSVTFRNVV